MTVTPPTKNQRLCISCRRKDDRDFFWRVIRVWPSQQIQLDKGMGRSAYLCPSTACLKQAQRKDRLSKVLKARVPPEIFTILWERLQVEP
jgi:uncharacterized protein